MNKLMYAGYTRLFKSKALYICLAVLLYTNFFSVLGDMIVNGIPENKDSAQAMLMSGFMVMTVLIPVFVCSFIGSEHSFGTIRNKMIIGCKRSLVYISCLLLSLMGVTIMYALIWGLTGLLCAAGTLDISDVRAEPMLIMLICSYLAAAVITAADTALALCIQSKSVSSVAALLLSFVMMIAAVVTTQRLSEPEYTDPRSLVTEDSADIIPDSSGTGLVKNPLYLDGSARKRYQTVYDICPVTNMLNTGKDFAGKNVYIPAAEIVLLLAGGASIFGKRDLK